MTKFFFVIFLFLLILIDIQSVHAQKKSRFRPSAAVPYNPKEHVIVKENGKNVVYKKKTSVDFDGNLIEGEITNPNEFYFVHRPEEKFGSLVKKRKNFHKEMLRDTVMIR